MLAAVAVHDVDDGRRTVVDDGRRGDSRRFGQSRRLAAELGAQSGLRAVERPVLLGDLGGRDGGAGSPSCKLRRAQSRERAEYDGDTDDRRDEKCVHAFHATHGKRVYT